MEIEFLKQAELFENLPEDILIKLSNACLIRSIEHGEFFFFEGDEAKYIFVLKLGQVKLLQYTPDGRQVAMRIAQPGQTFAGISMLQPKGGYQVTAQAMSESTALLWDGLWFRQFAEEHPQVSINMMQVLRMYMKEMQERYKEMTTERVERRVARALIRLAKMSGAKDKAGHILLSLSRQDLAEMAGTTLFTASRLLAEWERQGIVDTGREKLAIVSPHELAKIAEDLEK